MPRRVKARPAPSQNGKAKPTPRPPAEPKARERDLLFYHAATSFLGNLFRSREEYIAKGIDGENRSLDEECQYNPDPSPDDCQQMYDKEAVAQRVVGCMPDECFFRYPDLYETERPRNTAFERAVVELQEEVNFWSYLHRGDVQSGIGRFGGILYGLDQTRSLESPVLDEKGRRIAKRPHKLKYLQVFGESSLKIADFERREFHPRLNRPTFYEISVPDPTGLSQGSTPLRVHHSRVLHLADNRASSEVFGVPRLRPVFNRVQDIRKLLGSSAEMFYKGAFPGLAFKNPSGLTEQVEFTDENLRALKKQFKDYWNRIQRALYLENLDVAQLLPQIADPTAHLTQQYIALAAALRVPLPILLGHQAGQLAGTQDSQLWHNRLSGRQRMYLDPFVIRPFVKRLVQLGVLPEPRRVIITWPDLNSLSEEMKAEISLKKAQALAQYVTGKIQTICTPKQFWVEVMGATDAVAEDIQEAAKAQPKSDLEQTIPPPPPEPTPAHLRGGSGAGRTGPSARTPGRPARTSGNPQRAGGTPRK